MNELAQKALMKLLLAAENAHARGGAKRKITLQFSEASFPEYLAMDTHRLKTECNADLERFAKANAIHIRWDWRAGEKESIEAIELADQNKLAQGLSLAPRWIVVANAEERFESYSAEFPVLNQVVDRWRRGVKARNTGPQEVDSWLDAIRIIGYCQESDDLEIPVRRLSTVLLDGSKRLESLIPLLDALLQADLELGSRDKEEVLSELGLIKYPQTLLIGGCLDVHIGADRITIPPPYLGFPPNAITGFTFPPQITRILSIENLETFYEVLAQANRDSGIVVIYTGGMPSPSWKRAYVLLISALPQHIKLFHWGDLDAGGFRIASHIADCCHRHAKALHLAGMSSAAKPEIYRKRLSSTEISDIRRTCEKWGWHKEITQTDLFPYAVEQESLPVNAVMVDVFRSESE